MENNPYEPPRELEKLTEGEPKKSKRSDATICLTLSGILLFMTGLLAALPGGYWGMFLMALIFGTLGLFMAETRMKRVMGGLLVMLSLAGVVFDLVEAKRWEDKMRLKREQPGKPSSQGG